jgi:flavodoxin
MCDSHQQSINPRRIMKKVLIAYVSRTGKTEAMANYIAEGLRITGKDVERQEDIGPLKMKRASSGTTVMCSAAPPITRT